MDRAAVWFRSNRIGIDARLAVIVIVALGLFSWVGSATGPVSAAPAVFAVALVVGDAAVAFRRSGRTVELMVASVDSSPDSRVELGRPLVDVRSVHALTSTGEVSELIVTEQADGSLATEPAEHVGRPIEELALVAEVTAQALGLTLVSRRAVFARNVTISEPLEAEQGGTPPGLVDTLRPYVAGDARNRVDWKSTARTSVLHVRSAQTSDADDLVVVVELQPDAGAERHVSAIRKARLVASAALRQKRSVRLVTMGVPGNAARELVTDSLGVGQSVEDVAGALARWSPSLVDDSVACDAELMHRLAWCRPGLVPPIDPGEVRCS